MKSAVAEMFSRKVMIEAHADLPKIFLCYVS